VRTHKSLSLIAAGVMLAAGTALAAGPAALADPINSHSKAVTPAYYDVVGVGADTDETLFDQLAFDYDGAHKTHNKTHPYIYSWDATPPNSPLNTTSTITPKQGCAKIGRPDGSGAGITAFENGAKTHGHYCIDFARSASFRPSSDPDPLGKNLYVALAEDAEVYTVTANGDAPKSLTVSQLTEIYSCNVPAAGGHPANNWADLGGKNAAIDVVSPASTTGVGKFWLQVLGLKSLASCVTVVQQNEGIDTKVFGTASKPNKAVIVPFSVGKYISERWHSAPVGKNPTGKENKFGRDERGDLVLGTTAGVAPTVGTGANTKINKALDDAGKANFTRQLYDVVWYAHGSASSDKDGIPTSLEQFFAPARNVKVKGWFCADKEAQQAIVDYGFLTTPLCGLGA
jgi:ABC-type phosphate transport system substrate-binding protein